VVPTIEQVLNAVQRLGQFRCLDARLVEGSGFHLLGDAVQRAPKGRVLLARRARLMTRRAHVRQPPLDEVLAILWGSTNLTAEDDLAGSMPEAHALPRLWGGLHGPGFPDVKRNLQTALEHQALPFRDEVNKHHPVVQPSEPLAHVPLNMPLDAADDLLLRVLLSEPAIEAEGGEGHASFHPPPHLKETFVRDRS